MKYKRLPGGRRGFFRQASLWLGDDHVLAVTGWRFTEDYKRYYYRDIQALALARTPRWAVTLPWFFVALVLFLVALVARAGEVAWLPDVCWALVVALAVAWLFVSLQASVRCTIQTAVSREELPSLFRFWSSERAIRILGDRIAQVQGTLVAGWTAHVREVAVEAPAAAAEPMAAPLRDTKERGQVSRLLEMSAYFSLALGGLLFYRTAARAWYVLILLQAGLAAASLIRNERRRGPRRIKRLMIAIMAFVGLMAAGFYGRIVMEALRAVAARRVPLDVPLNPILVIIYTAGCLVLMAAGVILALTKE
ncbi:MAG TPA: hypothetical protein VN893_03160 [Bryobacteraceae bacterium]|nr:hypothetical protein [Bryobacteraceae bacterium]